MKSVRVNNSSICLIDIPPPICEAGDIVLRLGACGICGSDIANIFGNSCKPSTKIGHEISGTIIKVGSGVNGFHVGDRVFVHHHTSCGDCYLCKKGNETMCEKFTDSLHPNGLSEMFLLPKWNVEQGCLFRIPNWMSFEEAALIEPLACCVRAWKKASNKITSVAIFGLGSIGIFHAFLAKIHNVKNIFCIDMNEFRLDFCKSKEIGIALDVNSDYVDYIFSETGGIGADLIIIAAPDISIINDAIRIVRKGGKIIIMGEPKKSEIINIDFNLVCTKEVTILTSYAASNNDVHDALELIKSKLVNVTQLITHRFSLDECEKALDIARQRQNSIKIVIVNT